MSERYYYHAGAIDETTNDARWSNHTRRSFAAARREALRMAANGSRRPVVEYWDRAHGLCPGDQNAIAGADFVEADQ